MSSMAVGSFPLIRCLPVPVPLLFLSSVPTTPLPGARIQPPEHLVRSPWELVLTLSTFLSSSAAEVGEFLG